MKLIAEIEEWEHEGQKYFIAMIKTIPGMVVEADTPQKAFNELMVSLKCKILYDSGITY